MGRNGDVSSPQNAGEMPRRVAAAPAGYGGADDGDRGLRDGKFRL